MISKPVDYRDFYVLQVCVNDLEGVKLDGFEMVGRMRTSDVYVTLSGVDNYKQYVKDESFSTQSLSSLPYKWGEEFIVGEGEKGLKAIAGLSVEVYQSSGLVCEGVVGFDVLFSKLDSNLFCQHLVSMMLPTGRSCVFSCLFGLPM